MDTTVKAIYVVAYLMATLQNRFLRVSLLMFKALKWRIMQIIVKMQNFIRAKRSNCQL